MHKELNDQFVQFLRLKSRPIAVRMLKSAEDIPNGSIRPLKDMGHHLSLCQAFSMARRQGLSIAMLKEDNWCFEPVVGLGFEAPPAEFLEGANRYPGTAKTVEAGSRWARQMPKFPAGKYAGLVFAPLDKANFEPEMVILYCDPAQLTQIMIAVNWIDGNDVTCVLSGHSACVYAVVPVIENGQFQVSVPCIGDRKRALAQDTELIFSMPLDKAKDLAEGLRVMEEKGSGFPMNFDVKPEYELEKSYQKFGRMLGIKID